MTQVQTPGHGDLPANVFMGIGGLEELTAMASFRVVTNVSRLETVLRAKKSQPSPR